MPKQKALQATGRNLRQIVGADGEQWFTRTQAAKFLKMSTVQVIYHEKRHRLRTRVVKGIHLFARAVLEDFQRNGPATKDHLAAAAFTQLDAGATPAQLVTDLKISPDLAVHFTKLHRKLSLGDIDSE